MTPNAPAIDDSERTDARALTLPLVAAQVLQNVLGGILIGNAVAALMWLAGVDLSQYWRIPVGIGWFVAGAAGIRAFADEFRADRRWRQREREHAEEMRELADALDELEEQVAAEREQHALELQAATDSARTEQRRADNLEVELAWERTTNRREKAGRNTVHTVDLVPPQLKTDCRRFVELWQSTGKRPTRNSMMADGLSRTRWDELIVELKRAGVWEWAGSVDATRMHMKLDAQWAHPPTPRDDGRDGQEYSSTGGAGIPPAQGAGE
jgi:hypothetical protein